MNKKLKLAVIMGGDTRERSTSLASGQTVAKALIANGHSVVCLDSAAKNFLQDIQAGFDLVYILLHGGKGEDGTIQGILDYLQIPYVGTGVLGSAISMNKMLTKELLLMHNIPVPAGEVCEAGDFNYYATKYQLPFILKPISEGSSFGVNLIQTQEQFISVLNDWQGVPMMVEEYIQGEEISVGILDNKVLPPIKIIPKSGFYDYKAKYVTQDTVYECPAQLTEVQDELLVSISAKAFKVLHGRHLGRVDLICDSRGNFWVLEMNTVPGMTPTSLLPKCANCIGLDVTSLVAQVIECALTKVAEQAYVSS